MKPASLTWPQYIRAGLGRRLSLLGEKLKIDWLIYNPIHFMHFHEHALLNAPGVMRAFAQVFPEARRYLDVGAGSGAFSAQANRTGRVSIACEHNAKGRQLAQKQGVDCRPFDLMKDPPAKLDGPFDLAFCFEVAEHLPPDLGDRLVRFIAQCASLAVFTAAHPGQGGTGHINEQPKSYWIERFEKAGMRYSPELSQRLEAAFRAEKLPGTWLIENVCVFVK